MMLTVAAATRRIPACRSRLLVASQSVLNRGNVLKTDECVLLGGTRTMSDLPYHIVVGMPALSPTMEAGSIASWKIEEGGAFSAGDSLAEIQTDKATIDFEAQDDGVVAKHLVQPSDDEIKVGVPIMVTVEEADDVAAFKDFTVDASDGAEPAPPADTKTEAPTDTPSTSAPPAADLPYHIVVGMPALSPTMEAGTISSWKIGEGEAFSAGDSIAEIETDKATIDFEAQDDGVVAKHLVQAGGGEIKVGVPIMVTVEELDDVAAFKDFVAATEAPAAATPAAPPAPEVEKVASPTPQTPAPPVIAEAPAATPVATPPDAEKPAVAPVLADAAPTVGPAWGKLARTNSPLAKTLSADQAKYIEMYGSTGQIPL